MWPGPDPYNHSERLNPNPNPKMCEIANLYGAKVHFCDQNSMIWIFHKFHKRVHINKRRFFWFMIFLCFSLMHILQFLLLPYIKEMYNKPVCSVQYNMYNRLTLSHITFCFIKYLSIHFVLSYSWIIAIEFFVINYMDPVWCI